jgi:translation initiation factor 4G
MTFGIKGILIFLLEGTARRRIQCRKKAIKHTIVCSSTLTMATMAIENDHEERQHHSLLAKALDVPTLNDHQRPPEIQKHESSDSGAYSFGGSPFLGMPRHSDFTIPTSNISEFEQDAPPPDLLLSTSAPRRSVFGISVAKKYGNSPFSRVESTDTLETDNHSSLPVSSVPLQTNSARNFSGLTPPSSPRPNSASQVLSPLTPFNHNNNNDSKHDSDDTTAKRVHETTHAQSLLLGFAFMAIWSPQNIMAPNLTEIANDFNFSPEQRDLYLGSIVALATGVVSLPISAGIGILADVCNRKYLYCTTVAMGGLFAWATGASRSFRWLFWARLLNGGCMSGSVPVAFSLLGDLFHTHERNAASSGLTAMMGCGIIAGQVYAGVVGSTLGWPHAFYISSLWTLLAATLVFMFVQEPERGGKEKVLQDMISQGTRYEKKLSWEGFFHAMRHNKSNVILMWQGFFSSVPWGIIFVFLNDYLSQERGFSVPDATFLVLVFGLGCAAGGVLGGWWGQVIMHKNRSYLPLFMALTTFLGIFPFLALLNGSFTNAHGFAAVFFSFMGGLIASLPSVNVRPCIINVNPPETRGAALTAANLIINLARGAGPSCITLMGAIWGVNRQFSFNVTVRRVHDFVSDVMLPRTPLARFTSNTNIHSQSSLTLTLHAVGIFLDSLVTTALHACQDSSSRPRCHGGGTGALCRSSIARNGNY